MFHIISVKINMRFHTKQRRLKTLLFYGLSGWANSRSWNTLSRKIYSNVNSLIGSSVPSDIPCTQSSWPIFLLEYSVKGISGDKNICSQSSFPIPSRNFPFVAYFFLDRYWFWKLSMTEYSLNRILSYEQVSLHFSTISCRACGNFWSIRWLKIFPTNESRIRIYSRGEFRILGRISILLLFQW